MPIRLRLTLLAAAGSVVLVVVAGAIFLAALHSGLRSSLDTGLRSRADTLSQSVREAGPNVNFEDPGNTRLVKTTETLAQVINPTGQVIESTRAAGPRSLINTRNTRHATSGVYFVEGKLPGDDQPIRLLVNPVDRADGRWLIVVGSSLEGTNDAIDRVQKEVLVVGALTVLFAAGGAWILASLALRPVERMRRQAAALSARDANGRLPVPATHDEIAELGTTMNSLLSRLHSALAQQQAFVADAGHELRTPLAILRTELELAARPDRTLPELRLAVTEAAEETDRLIRLAEELLFLALHDEQQSRRHYEVEPLQPLLERSTDAARLPAAVKAVRFTTQVPADLVVSVVSDDLRRAVDNLLANAIRFAPPKSLIELVATPVGDTVQITVKDRGPGFPEEFLPHAFERFRRADSGRTRDDGGTGLGLAIVQAVAHEHNGRAYAINRVGGGAEVTLEISGSIPDM